MRRGFLAWLSIVAILAALGAVAYFSHNPQSIWLTRLRGWPVIGSVAGRFQDAFNVPHLPPEAQSNQISVVVVPPPAEDLDVHPYTHLNPGALLRERPEMSAPLVKRLDRYYVVPYLSRREDWVLVHVDGQRGWVRVGPPLETAGPPLGERPSPPHPLAGRAAPSALLAAAAREMGAARRGQRVGPYPLLTDVREPGLIPAMDRLARQIEPLYRERYGLTPVGQPRATVVLFAKKSAFDAFNRSDPRLRGLHPEGTEVPGLITLYAEGRSWTEIEATMVHEITHLLNRRAVGPALPPWLDEGMAEDLASSRITPVGTIDASVLAGMMTVDGRRRTLRGARAGVLMLAKQMRSGAAPNLARLTALDWVGFVAVPSAADHYREAGLLIRYLATGPAVAGQSQRPRNGLRNFLRGVARGGPATGDALLQSLGVSWSQLQSSFLAWLDSEIPAPFTLESEVSQSPPGDR